MKKLHQRIKQNLAKIEANGLKRSLTNPHGVDFSSNDFLGLSQNEEIKKAAIEAIETLGIGSTASRLLRGEREVFAEVEKQFADWKGAEKSLYFSSGYQANIGLISTIAESGDVIFSDELNHASLIDGIRLSNANKVIFPHLDYEKLARLLSETSCTGQKILITESLFSMDGDIAPLDKYAEICKQTGTVLIVDEAHAVGIYGETGSGLIEEFGLEHDLISINTAGKALGVSGAFVAGSGEMIEYLINRCRSFIFSTAPPPVCAVALSKAIEIVRNDSELRRRLQNLSKYFHNLLAEHGLAVPKDATQIIPILIGDSRKAVKVAQSLQLKGFDVRAIRPPTVPEGTARLRVSLNVNLTEDILESFVKSLVKYLK
jgi:8-amino-7-oxononanoate synthase